MDPQSTVRNRFLLLVLLGDLIPPPDAPLGDSTHLDTPKTPPARPETSTEMHSPYHHSHTSSPCSPAVCNPAPLQYHHHNNSSLPPNDPLHRCSEPAGEVDATLSPVAIFFLLCPLDLSLGSDSDAPSPSYHKHSFSTHRVHGNNSSSCKFYQQSFSRNHRYETHVGNYSDTLENPPCRHFDSRSKCHGNHAHGCVCDSNANPKQRHGPSDVHTRRQKLN